MGREGSIVTRRLVTDAFIGGFKSERLINPSPDIPPPLISTRSLPCPTHNSLVGDQSISTSVALPASASCVPISSSEEDSSSRLVNIVHTGEGDGAKWRWECLWGRWGLALIGAGWSGESGRCCFSTGLHSSSFVLALVDDSGKGFEVVMGVVGEVSKAGWVVVDSLLHRRLLHRVVWTSSGSVDPLGSLARLTMARVSRPSTAVIGEWVGGRVGIACADSRESS